MESISGLSLNDVKVHRNSDKPAQLQAHAYAQGTDIHLGPGQEKHLPHELGHVVQQKQGRVKPTVQLKGKVNINDDPGLEKEADVLGAKAANYKGAGVIALKKTTISNSSVQKVAQLTGGPFWPILKKATLKQPGEFNEAQKAFIANLRNPPGQSNQGGPNSPPPEFIGTSDEMFGDNREGNSAVLDKSMEFYYGIKEIKKDTSTIMKMLDIVFSEKAVDFVNNAVGQGETTSGAGAVGQVDALSTKIAGGDGLTGGGGIQPDGKIKPPKEESDSDRPPLDLKLEDSPVGEAILNVTGGDVTTAGFDEKAGIFGVAVEAVKHLKDEYSATKLASKKAGINAKIAEIQGELDIEADQAQQKKLMSQLKELKIEITELDFEIEESKISIYESRIQILANSARLSLWLTAGPVAAAITAVENLRTAINANAMIEKFKKLDGTLKIVAIDQLQWQVKKNALMGAANASNASSLLTGGAGAATAAVLGTASAAQQTISFIRKYATGSLGKTREQFANDCIKNLQSEKSEEKNEAIKAIEILKIEDKVYANRETLTLNKGAAEVIADSLKTGKNYDLFVEGFTKLLEVDSIPTLR